MIVQTFVAEILLEIECAKADGRMQLQSEEAAAQDTAALLGAASGVAGTLHHILEALGARMEQVYLEASGQVQGKYRLEQLLLAERQRGGELEKALTECREVAGTAINEFAGLEAQVEQQLVERAALEVQVNKLLC